MVIILIEIKLLFSVIYYIIIFFLLILHNQLNPPLFLTS